MPNPEDVIPGELIEAVWGNQVRDQSVQPFPDATARDVSIPLPDEGLVAYLSDPGTITVYDGAQWVDLDVLLGGPFLPLTGGTLSGSLTVGGQLTVDEGGATTRVRWNGASGFVGVLERGTQSQFTLTQAGPQAVRGFTVRDGGPDGTPVILEATASGVVVNPIELGDGATELRWSFTRATEGLRAYANNTAGTSILEYLRINKEGTTPRVSYRGSASTSTATANATWFTSNEITSGSRSIGQGSLAQSDHVDPSPVALDAATDPAVAAVRSVPVRRGRYQAGYLVDGDPRIGVDHPMILADELEALNPELVDRLPVFDDDGVAQADDLVVNQSILTAVLVAAIQDLTDRVAALESSQ